MKKNYLLVGLFALGMMALQGCDEVAPGTGDGGATGEPDLGGTMEKLEPSAQKARLQEAGLEFVNEIKAGDHKNLVDVVGYIDENLEFDIDTAYVGKIERLYEDSYTGGDNYYDGPVAAVRNLMAISLDAAQSGAQLSQSAAEVYTATIQAGLTDLYGGFTPDMEEEMWVYDSKVNDRLEVSFTDNHNQKWVATLKGSKETTRVKVNASLEDTEESHFVDGPDAGTTSVDKDEEHYKYVIDVPKEITFTVKCNNTNVVDLTLNSSVAFESNFNVEMEDTYQRFWEEWTYGGYWDWEYDESVGEYVQVWVDEVTEGWYTWGDSESKEVCTFDVDYTNLNMDATLKVNAYEETFKSELTKQGMSASMNVKINGKQMLKVEGALKADIDAAIEEGEDAYNEEKNLDEVKIGALKELSMFIDLVGKVQVVGKCNKFDEMFDALLGLEDADDSNDFVKYQRNLDLANKAYSITLHYDNTETVQANIEAEAYQWEDDWNDGFIFSTRPVIVFTSDESRYSFEDYFTKRSFGDLVDAVENLYDDFKETFEDYFEEEVEVMPDHNYGEY